MSAKELCLHVSASQGINSVNGVAILTRVFYKKSVWWFLSGCQKK